MRPTLLSSSVSPTVQARVTRASIYLTNFYTNYVICYISHSLFCFLWYEVALKSFFFCSMLDMAGRLRFILARCYTLLVCSVSFWLDGTDWWLSVLFCLEPRIVSRCSFILLLTLHTEGFLCYTLVRYYRLMAFCVLSYLDVSLCRFSVFHLDSLLYRTGFLCVILTRCYIELASCVSSWLDVI